MELIINSLLFENFLRFGNKQNLMIKILINQLVDKINAYFFHMKSHVNFYLKTHVEIFINFNLTEKIAIHLSKIFSLILNESL